MTSAEVRLCMALAGIRLCMTLSLTWFWLRRSVVRCVFLSLVTTARLIMVMRLV